MYRSSDVAELLGISEAQVRRYAKSGFLSPERGPKGEYRFSFQDLVLLRTAVELTRARVPAKTVKSALRKLRQQLPEDRPLTELHVSAEDDEIVVRDGNTIWNAKSDQMQLNFAVADLATEVAPLARRAAAEARDNDQVTAEGWYELGCELEDAAPGEAKRAYRRAVARAPHHSDAHVNLGRLLHEEGDLRRAADHYRAALAAQPENPTAAYNLGVALEDLRHSKEAIEMYRRALVGDPDLADAHYNLARLYEKTGKPRAALRHYRAYRNLIKGR